MAVSCVKFSRVKLARDSLSKKVVIRTSQMNIPTAYNPNLIVSSGRVLGWQWE